MNIEKLLELVPLWVQTSFAFLMLFGLIGWRIFRHVIKINKAVNQLKEESYKELLEMYDEVQQRNKQLRTENKLLRDQNQN